MFEEENILTRVEIKEAIVGVRRDGLIHVYYKPGITLTVELQKKMLEIFRDLTMGKDTPFVWQAGKNVRLTKEARLNAARIERFTPCEASAVVVNSWYQKIIADWYYKLNKPGMIYKVTWNFQKAIEWLKSVHEDANVA